LYLPERSPALRDEGRAEPFECQHHGSSIPPAAGQDFTPGDFFNNPLNLREFSSAYAGDHGLGRGGMRQCAIYDFSNESIMLRRISLTGG